MVRVGDRGTEFGDFRGLGKVIWELECFIRVVGREDKETVLIRLNGTFGGLRYIVYYLE